MKVDQGVCIKFMKLKLLSNVLRHFVLANENERQDDKELVSNIDSIL